MLAGITAGITERSYLRLFAFAMAKIHQWPVFDVRRRIPADEAPGRGTRAIGEAIGDPRLLNHAAWTTRRIRTPTGHYDAGSEAFTRGDTLEPLGGLKQSVCDMAASSSGISRDGS